MKKYVKDSYVIMHELILPNDTNNLDTVLRRATSLPISIAEEPLLCVVKGTGEALEQKSKLGDLYWSE